MTTITIVQVNPPPPGSSTETVDVYVYDGASTNLWIWTVRDVPTGTPLTTIQAQLDASAAALLSACQGDVPVAAGDRAIQLQWVAAHKTWMKTFLVSQTTLDYGMLTIPDTTLASYRTVLTNALNAAAGLPTPFLTLFTNIRIAQTLNMPVSTMTAIQCAAFENLMRSWLTARIANALVADTARAWLLGL